MFPNGRLPEKKRVPKLTVISKKKCPKEDGSQRDNGPTNSRLLGTFTFTSDRIFLTLIQHQH